MLIHFIKEKLTIQNHSPLHSNTIPHNDTGPNDDIRANATILSNDGRGMDQDMSDKLGAGGER